ncbi:MAG TPA: hypothetical protein VG387_19615 [Rhizomicrobium sp.]|jgi:hypothetical protein|nr:hypothetical protein [Rhizomicrobium sp.]
MHVVIYAQNDLPGDFTVERQDTTAQAPAALASRGRQWIVT